MNELPLKTNFEIFRVRKSAHDIKSQKGAYFILENAVLRAKKTKCNVYDNNLKCVFKFCENNI